MKEKSARHQTRKEDDSRYPCSEQDFSPSLLFGFAISWWGLGLQRYQVVTRA